ncbi:MAG: Sir2 family NAD-dependent protein deacetylase [Stagnimonas sp.]|nr:Sir2 family NAD-dependent protein deacetylase [Stagnimonas sp.]
METLDPGRYSSILLFTGAGLSAESGVPTYRGAGGIWGQYRYQDYACQQAFERDPEQVLDFHELRRAKVLECAPHAGHLHLARLQLAYPQLRVVTQNIDGLLQRAGVRVDAELHGSLWRVRCGCGVQAAPPPAAYRPRRCPHCAQWRRPDITWFEDAVNESLFEAVGDWVRKAELFVSIGTSGAVWPAAGFAQLAKRSGADMVEINPEDNEASPLYTRRVRQRASAAIPALFPLTTTAAPSDP